MTKFNFGNIVKVEENLVGVVVKCWGPSSNGEQGPTYEVYVRSYRGIKTYPENEVMHFVYDKELSDEQLEYYE